MVSCVGVATKIVATLGVGLPASCRMTSLGLSTLHMESYVVVTLGVGLPASCHGDPMFLLAWFAILSRRRFASVVSNIIPSLISALNGVSVGVATLGIALPALCRVAYRGFATVSVVNVGVFGSIMSCGVPISSWLHLEYWVGDATVGVFFSASCRMAFLGFSTLFMESCVGVTTIGVATPGVVLSASCCMASRRSSSHVECCVGFGMMGVASLGLGLPASCDMPSLGSSLYSESPLRNKQLWSWRRSSAMLSFRATRTTFTGNRTLDNFPEFWPSCILFLVSREKHAKFGVIRFYHSRAISKHTYIQTWAYISTM
jgi:hypothetical protein